jgi:lipopolysaccharide export system protein LptA
VNRKILYAIMAGFLLVSTVNAAGLAGAERNKQPITIKSNELATDANKRTSVFSGNVAARQGDLTIFAEKLIITYSADNHEVEKVEAFDKVRIIQGVRQAQAGHAIYEIKSGKITLDGAPRVSQGDDSVSGKIIDYYLDEQKSVVKGGANARVEAVIHPGSKGKNDNAKP